VCVQVKMIGQLDWEGVVHPIQEMSWDNVLATAQRFQGLELNEEFFVTYKDEEGDLINIKNDVDLSEAIRWAEEQGVPCLCLHVPFASSDSDSEDSWTEVADSTASPRLTAQDVPSQQRAETPEVFQPLSESTPEDHVEPEENESCDEDEVSHSEQHQDTQEGMPADESHDEEEVELEAHEPTPENDVETNEGSFNCEQDTAPVQVETVQVETSEPIVEDRPQVHAVDADSHTGVDRIVELLYMVNSGSDELETTGEPASKLLLDVLADKNAVKTLADIFTTSAFQAAVVTVAQNTKSKPESVLKFITTQFVKLLYKQPGLYDQLARLPNFEQVFIQGLRTLKTKQEQEVKNDDTEAEAEARVVHENVVCDGCPTNPERFRECGEKGYRSSSGHIQGVRYKSSILPDYDLCESCEASGDFQTQAGPFLKIVDPATAPEVILCALPGTTAGMMSQVESLDWRNPLAKEFLDFVNNRRMRPFPQQRQQVPSVVAAPPALAGPKVEEVVAVQAPKPVMEVTLLPSVLAPKPVTEVTVMPSILAEAATVVTAPVVRCAHPLKTFTTQHGNFSCDVCSKSQAVRTMMHGCRSCNFDICVPCQALHKLQLEQPIVTVPVPAPVALAAPTLTAPPQAKFVSDVTLADGCVVRVGERLDKIWRVRNSGSERWPAGTRIAHVGGDAFGGPMGGVEVPLAAPGEAVNVTVPLIMPSQAGRYTSYWRMMTPHPANAKFGHRFWVTVNVVTPQPSVAPSAPTLATPGVVIRPPPPAPFNFVAGSPQVPPASFPRAPPPPPPSVRPSAPPAPVQEEPVVPPEHELAVSQIIEFGFSDIDKIVKILKEVNGDASATIDRLLEDA
jgi:hypothetical protein